MANGIESGLRAASPATPQDAEGFLGGPIGPGHKSGREGSAGRFFGPQVSFGRSEAALLSPSSKKSVTFPWLATTCCCEPNPRIF